MKVKDTFCSPRTETPAMQARKVTTVRSINNNNGRPKRAELPDVNINTGTQSINTKRASRALRLYHVTGVCLPDGKYKHRHTKHFNY